MSGRAQSPLEQVRAAESVAVRELATIPDWLWDGVTLPVPVEDICDSHYGLLVEEHEDLAALVGAPPGTHLSGLLFGDRREVWVNAGEAPVRRRFTVGHELGHWVLHAGRGEAHDEAIVHCRESEVREEAGGEIDLGHDYLDYPPAELDANQFAVAMLMPLALVEVDEGRAPRDEILCRTLGVSAEALRRRRWFLGHRAVAAASRSRDSG